MIDTTRKISAHFRIVIARSSTRLSPARPLRHSRDQLQAMRLVPKQAGGEVIAARFVLISLVAGPAGEAGMGGIIARQATRRSAGADDARRRRVGHAGLVDTAAADAGGRRR